VRPRFGGVQRCIIQLLQALEQQAPSGGCTKLSHRECGMPSRQQDTLTILAQRCRATMQHRRPGATSRAAGDETRVEAGPVLGELAVHVRDRLRDLDTGR
jgi:hypothetical protein